MSMKSADNDKSVAATGSSSSSWDWTKIAEKADSVIKTVDSMGKSYSALKSDLKEAIGSWSETKETPVVTGAGFSWLPLAIAGGFALMKLI